MSLRDKIHRRGGHVVFYHRGEMFVWGGLLERVDRVKRKILKSYIFELRLIFL